MKVDDTNVTVGGAATPSSSSRLGRNPAELFGEFCAVRGVDDARVLALFNELLDQRDAGDEGDGAGTSDLGVATTGAVAQPVEVR